jgi:hypothetical protein
MSAIGKDRIKGAVERKRALYGALMRMPSAAETKKRPWNTS